MEELEEALSYYTGPLVTVTHERMARTRFTGVHVELAGGTVVGRRGIG